MKNIITKVSLMVFFLTFFTTNIIAINLVNEKQCKIKGEEYIFAGGECIQFYVSEGDIESEINIVVHGTWKEGANVLSRYAPFADNLSMATDITTIAIALPGYSDSSTNNFQALSHKATKNLLGKKEYIEFLSELIQELKQKFQAKKVNYIGHSAGAFIGSTLLGFTPSLLDTMTSAGAGFDIHSEIKDSENLISLSDYMDNIDPKTQFLLIYGTKDTISQPKITKNYYKVLKNKGFNVRLVEVLDAAHIDLDMSDTAVEAITEMLEKE